VNSNSHDIEKLEQTSVRKKRLWMSYVHCKCMSSLNHKQMTRQTDRQTDIHSDNESKVQIVKQ